MMIDGLLLVQGYPVNQVVPRVGQIHAWHSAALENLSQSFIQQHILSTDIRRMFAISIREGTQKKNDFFRT